jgi:prevent-host-death family protein
MRTVSDTDAKQRLAALLDAAQREPVLIRRQNRDVAVIISAKEYERIRGINNAELKRIMDRVGAQAAARGLTKSVLKSISPKILSRGRNRSNPSNSINPFPI